MAETSRHEGGTGAFGLSVVAGAAGAAGVPAGFGGGEIEPNSEYRPGMNPFKTNEPSSSILAVGETGVGLLAEALIRI
jgi:hypothetical protein